MTAPALVWFRDDHRLDDNPALAAAAATGAPVLCAVILDEESPGLRPLGGASRWWLHGSLDALARSLGARGAELLIFRGAAGDLVERIAREAKPAHVLWNRRYQQAEIALDRAIKERLAAAGIAARSFNGRLLHEPWEIGTRQGTPFQVYTPYWRAVLAGAEPAAPIPAPQRLRGGDWPASLRRLALPLDALALEPRRPDWAGGLREAFERGEAAAKARLAAFVESALGGYGEGRNRPDRPGSTRLSPHLRFGEIGPRQVWHAVRRAAHERSAPEADVAKLLSELVWRDFCWQVLHENPDLATAHHHPRFERFPFRTDAAGLESWRRGRTGYPVVDAGLRQLWRTGWMPNRVRMIAASFLVKDLLVDWREGEAWFWDTLVDADPASNAFNWQWIAGSGPDSAPFHRIFNPVAQGEKFDPDGAYVRIHAPELSKLPAALIHKPWEAPPAVLREAGIVLGRTYPRPVVEHGAARDRALDAFRSTRGDPA